MFEDVCQCNWLGSGESELANVYICDTWTTICGGHCADVQGGRQASRGSRVARPRRLVLAAEASLRGRDAIPERSEK